MYYIARNPDVSASRITLAHATGYRTLEAAMHDMGDGVVFNPSGDIVAFHERHAELLTRRGSARMSNVCGCGDVAEGGTCDTCDWVASQPPHVGHVLRLTGAWYCDTCDSPYCDLA